MLDITDIYNPYHLSIGYRVTYNIYPLVKVYVTENHHASFMAKSTVSPGAP